MTDRTPAQTLRAATERVIDGTPEIINSNLAWAIAKWLETTAAEMDAVDGTEYQAADGGDVASWNAALAVARQILGEVTE